MKFTRLLATALLALGTLFLASCSDGAAGGGAAATSTVQGSAVKGPVNGATVTLKRADTGATLGTTTTSASGNYSITTTYVGDVIVEITGGTYTDEATSQTTTLSGTMRTVLTTTSNGGEVSGMVTPLTSLAYQIAGSGGSITAAAFSTTAGTLATQFGLNGVNIVTTLPSVTGTINSYGNALRALSQYMSTNTLTFASFANSFTATTAFFATFGPDYQAAYSTINGQTITVAFDSTGFVIGGTGAGGGSGTCGINVTGSVTVMNITTPISFDYCVQGIAQGSCTSGNSSLSQSLSGQSGLVGATNLNYTYSASCASNAVTITLN